MTGETSMRRALLLWCKKPKASSEDRLDLVFSEILILSMTEFPRLQHTWQGLGLLRLYRLSFFLTSPFPGTTNSNKGFDDETDTKTADR